MNNYKYIEKINFNNKEVIFILFSSTNSHEEMLEVLDELEDIVRSLDPHLFLLDAEGAIVGNKFMKRIQALTKELLQYKNHKTAVIGISGYKSMMLKAYNLFSKNQLVPFSSKEEALNYLTT